MSSPDQPAPDDTGRHAPHDYAALAIRELSLLLALFGTATQTLAAWGTNLLVTKEATLRGGTYAVDNIDEAAAGYVMVKYDAGLTYARKTYFQFDLTGVSGDTNAPATFSVNYHAANAHAVQLWVLNQPYPGFSGDVTWNTAQANDTNSNDLLTSGSATATRLVSAKLLQPASANDWEWFRITNWGAYTFSGKITLALTTSSNTNNSAGGLRMDRFESVLAIPPLSHPPPSTAAHFDVYLVGGQSNMDGRGGNNHLVGANAPWSQPQTAVRIWYANPMNYGHPLTPNYDSGWQVLGPGFSVPSGFSATPLPSPCFGPELSFARTIADANPQRQIALIKVTQGGTTLNGDWNPANPGSGYMYVALTNTVRVALQALTDAGASYTLRGMIWHQGEGDSSGSAATNYEANLTQLIAAVRRDVGVANLPFVVGELATNKSSLVRSAQVNVAQKLPYVGFASADALQTIDSTHFTSGDVLTLGKRFAAGIETPTTRITGLSRNATNWVLTAVGLGRAPCRVLAATNVGLPLASWAPLSTNSFNAAGQLALTNMVAPGGQQEFYTVQPD